VKIAIVQTKPRKGDRDANVAGLTDAFRQLHGDAPDLIALPEAALTGYFLEGGVYELAESAPAFAARLAGAWKASGARGGVEVVCGFYENDAGTYYNSALYASLDAKGGARVVHVHRKLFLPTYGVFDEERFHSRGKRLETFATPFGRAAIMICEDAWHGIVPTIAAVKGARLFFVPSASPGRGIHIAGELESIARWRSLLQNYASEHGVFIVYAGLAGFEGGKGMTGSSQIVGPRGETIVQAGPLDACIVRAEIDLAEIEIARAGLPLLGDLHAVLPDLLAELDEHNVVSQEMTLPVIQAARPDPYAATRSDPEVTARWLEAFLRDELVRRRSIEAAVIGLSGGVDSATVAYLCARALGPKNVYAIRMPYKTSSPSSLADAQLVVDALGIHERTIEITQAVDGYLLHEPDADARRRGNVMARMRMVVLFDQSAKLGALPIGTGNKTERLMGYFTWHADDTPPLNPIGDLFKTQVWDLARYLGVPLPIVDKPPSADLEANQTDESDLGITYRKADAILAAMLEGFDDAQIARLGFELEEVRLVRRRIDSTHWKRHLPTTAMLTSTAINEFYLRPVDF
jgi:NAD+ synthetase